MVFEVLKFHECLVLHFSWFCFHKWPSLKLTWAKVNQASTFNLSHDHWCDLSNISIFHDFTILAHSVKLVKKFTLYQYTLNILMHECLCCLCALTACNTIKHQSGDKVSSNINRIPIFCSNNFWGFKFHELPTSMKFACPNSSWN